MVASASEEQLLQMHKTPTLTVSEMGSKQPQVIQQGCRECWHPLNTPLTVYKSSPLLEKTHHTHMPSAVLCHQDHFNWAPETILQTSESKQPGYTGESSGILWRQHRRRQLWPEKLIPAKDALLPARGATTAALCSQSFQPTQLQRVCTVLKTTTTTCSIPLPPGALSLALQWWADLWTPIKCIPLQAGLGFICYGKADWVLV